MDGSDSGRAVLLTSWLLTVCIVGYEIVPASVLPLIEADLGVGPAAASWVISVLFLGMAAGAFPAGVLLDRVDNRLVGLVSSLVVLAVTAWGWWAGLNGDYVSLVVSRFVGGAVFVTTWTACVNLVGASYGADRQATAIGLLSTSVPVGLTVGQFSGPLLAGVVGWEGTMPAFGALVGVTGVVFWASTRAAPAVVGAVRPTAADFVEVLTDPRVWGVAGLAFVGFSLNLFFNSWMASYVVDRFEVTLAVGGLFAAVFPAVGVVSRASSGLLSDRVFGRRRRPIVIGSLAVTVPAIVAIGLLPVPALLVGLLVVAGFSVQLTVAIVIPFVRELVDEKVVGTAFAVLNTVGFFGSFSTPIVTGVLLERSGSYTPMFAYATGLAVVGLAIAWVVPEPGRR